MSRFAPGSRRICTGMSSSTFFVAVQHSISIRTRVYSSHFLVPGMGLFLLSRCHNTVSRRYFRAHAAESVACVPRRDSAGWKGRRVCVLGGLDSLRQGLPFCSLASCVRGRGTVPRRGVHLPSGQPETCGKHTETAASRDGAPWRRQNSGRGGGEPRSARSQRLSEKAACDPRRRGRGGSPETGRGPHHTGGSSPPGTRSSSPGEPQKQVGWTRRRASSRGSRVTRHKGRRI